MPKIATVKDYKGRDRRCEVVFGGGLIPIDGLGPLEKNDYQNTWEHRLKKKK